MRIVVCIKQVPGSSEVRLDPETGTLIRDGRQAVVNPFDSYAIEQAVQLKEALGAQTTALSMGIPATERLLRDAVARGIDRAVLLTDRAFAGADTLATAYTLSLGVRKLGGADLVLCGRMAVDGDTAQIGPELAEFLGIPHVTDVTAITAADERSVTLWRATDQGPQRLRVALPALLAVCKDINSPRMPSIAGIRRGIAADFARYGAPDIGADPARCGLNGSPTRVVHTFAPDRAGKAVPLSGAPEEQAAQILSLWKEGPHAAD